VGARNQQNVTGEHWPVIQEGHCQVVFIHEPGRDFSGGDFAKLAAHEGLVPSASAATSVARALPTVVTSLGFLGVPAIGLVISTLWLGEAVTPTLVLGAVLIALGLILVITARQR